MKKILLATLFASSMNFCNAFKLNVGAVGGITLSKVKDKTSANSFSLAMGHGLHGLNTDSEEYNQNKSKFAEMKVFKENDIKNEKSEELKSKGKFDGSAFIDTNFFEHSFGSGKLGLGLFGSFGSMRVNSEAKEHHHEVKFKTNGWEVFAGPSISYVSPCGKFSVAIIGGPSIFKSSFSASLDKESVKKMITDKNITKKVAEEIFAEEIDNENEQLKKFKSEVESRLEKAETVSLKGTSVAFSLGLIASYKIAEKVNLILLLKSIPSKTIKYSDHKEKEHNTYTFKDKSVTLKTFQVSLGVSVNLV